VKDFPLMLRVYWFHALFKGDEKLCEELWLKHGLLSMVSSASINGRTYLAGNEERYFKMLKKLNIPPAHTAAALVRLAQSTRKYLC